MQSVEQHGENLSYLCLIEKYDKNLDIYTYQNAQTDYLIIYKKHYKILYFFEYLPTNLRHFHHKHNTCFKSYQGCILGKNQVTICSNLQRNKKQITRAGL